MKMWMESWKARCKAATTRRLLVAVLAIAAVGSVATFNFTKSAKAAAAPAPAAAALDDNSVEALLTLDRAMETLAARVTPAVVNVTVVSKANAQQSENGRHARHAAVLWAGQSFWRAVWQTIAVAAAEPDGARTGQRRDHLSRWIHRHQQSRDRGSSRYSRHHEQPGSAAGEAGRRRSADRSRGDQGQRNAICRACRGATRPTCIRDRRCWLLAIRMGFGSR